MDSSDMGSVSSLQAAEAIFFFCVCHHVCLFRYGLQWAVPSGGIQEEISSNQLHERTVVFGMEDHLF